MAAPDGATGVGDPLTAPTNEEPSLARWRLLRELTGLTEPTSENLLDEHEPDPKAPRQLSSAIEFDADGDRRYANDDADGRFARVAHVFHQPWHGIRSAAGTLPGHKIAIPLTRQLGAGDLFKVVSRLHDWKIEKVVFHGFSFAADRVLRAVSAFCSSCYLVWHGNLSQLVWKPEVKYFERALVACKRGHFRRAHMLKAGMGDILPRSFEPMLLNSPPVTGHVRLVPAFAGTHSVALVPAYTDIRKNLHSSLVGTALSRSIDDVLYYGHIRGAALPALARCKRIEYAGHDKHLAFLHDVDVMVNVTTIDCHPMVDLEAIAAGAMALTGPLFLDALEDHPFTKLSTMENPFDVREIATRLDHLKAMDNTELNTIISDYTKKLSAVSRERYITFLDL
jgi:hypothetical protein